MAAILAAVGGAVAVGTAYIFQRPDDEPPHVPSQQLSPKELSPPPAPSQHASSSVLSDFQPRYAEMGAASRRLPTVCKMLEEVANGPMAEYPAFKYEARPYPADHVAGWQTMTYKQYYEQSMRFARALHSLGTMERGNAVSIMGHNDKAWAVSHMGAMLAGGVSCGNYITNSADVSAHVANTSKSIVAVCDTMSNADKYMSNRGDIPTLKAVIVYGDAIPNDHPAAQESFLMSFETFLAKGDDDAVDSNRIKEIYDKITPGCVASLIFTSGTVGYPKGILTTHDNFMFTAFAACLGTEVMRDNEPQRFLSYLPLSHIAAQLMSLTFPLFMAWEYKTGATVYFARPDVQKGSLLISLRAVRPTVFFSVPRVWEKMANSIKAKMGASSVVKRKIFEWAQSIGEANGRARQLDGDGQLCRGTQLAESLVFSKVKEALGLDQCKRFYSSAAPISRDTLRFFSSLGMVITETYGASEATGLITASHPRTFLFGSVGVQMPGIELKIDHQPNRASGGRAARGGEGDYDPAGHGEIVVRSRCIMRGYLNDEAKTEEVINSEGWYYTGDIGRLDTNHGGALFITGRIREILITSGGENIAGPLIEEALKSALPMISNAVVVGDRRKFLSVLLTLKTDTHLETGEPLDTLADAARDVDPEACKTVADAMKSTKWKTVIEEGLRRANAVAVSRAHNVHRFQILPRDLSIGGGELTATMKVKRAVVCEKYQALIDEMYAKDGQ